MLETARGGILRRGLGYRKCTVGAVLNISADHLGLKGVDTLEQLAEVKRVVIEVAQDTAVLNADDPHCLRMADYTSAKHLCYVTQQHPPPAREGAHPRRRPRVVLEEGVNGHMITLFDHGAAHSAAVDAPDPGHARRAARSTTCRTRCSPRRWRSHGRQARGHPPRPAHVRHHVLPGAGPHERVRRASVQGDPRLRAQRRGGAGDVRPGRTAWRSGAGASACSRRPATAATRTSPRSGAPRPGTSITTSAAATTACAAARATRCRACCAPRCSKRACRRRRST